MIAVLLIAKIFLALSRFRPSFVDQECPPGALSTRNPYLPGEWKTDRAGCARACTCVLIWTLRISLSACTPRSSSRRTYPHRVILARDNESAMKFRGFHQIRKEFYIFI